MPIFIGAAAAAAAAAAGAVGVAVTAVLVSPSSSCYIGTLNRLFLKLYIHIHTYPII